MKRSLLRLVFVGVSVGAALGGCVSSHPEECLTMKTPVQFRGTGRPQVAVFFVSTGWRGGFGEAALDANGHILTVDDDPVYLTSEAMKQIMARVTVPEGTSGPPRILARARIRLEFRQRPNPAIPSCPTQSYYVIAIDELLDVLCDAGPTEAPAQPSPEAPATNR